MRSNIIQLLPFWATVKTIALGAVDDLMHYGPRHAASGDSASGRPQHFGAIVFTVAQKRFQSTAYLKFAKLQHVSSGFRCRLITGSLMRLT